MIKKRKVLFMALIVLLMSTIIGFAIEKSEKIEVFFRDIKVSVDNKEVKLRDRPFIYNDRIYVPLRFVSEALGSTVAWENKSSTVSINSFEDIPESNPLYGERFIYGEILDIDWDNRTLHIYQHFDDNSIDEKPNLKVSTDVIIVLQRNNKKINLDFDDLKIGDIVGMIMNKDNEIRGIIVTI